MHLELWEDPTRRVLCIRVDSGETHSVPVKSYITDNAREDDPIAQLERAAVFCNEARLSAIRERDELARWKAAALSVMGSSDWFPAEVDAAIARKMDGHG